MSNKVLNVMMSSDEDKVNGLHDELEEMRVYLLQEHDPETAEFLYVLQVEFKLPWLLLSWVNYMNYIGLCVTRDYLATLY